MEIAQKAGAEERGKILAKAVTRAADRIGLKASHFAQVIGVSESTVSRMKAGQYALNPRRKEFELSQLFLRLYRGLDSITGGDAEAARSWLHGQNTALGARPIDAMKTIRGLVATTDYVDSRRAVV